MRSFTENHKLSTSIPRRNLTSQSNRTCDNDFTLLQHDRRFCTDQDEIDSDTRYD